MSGICIGKDFDRYKNCTGELSIKEEHTNNVQLIVYVGLFIFVVFALIILTIVLCVVDYGRKVVKRRKKRHARRIKKKMGGKKGVGSERVVELPAEDKPGATICPTMPSVVGASAIADTQATVEDTGATGGPTVGFKGDIKSSYAFEDEKLKKDTFEGLQKFLTKTFTVRTLSSSSSDKEKRAGGSTGSPIGSDEEDEGQESVMAGAVPGGEVQSYAAGILPGAGPSSVLVGAQKKKKKKKKKKGLGGKKGGAGGGLFSFFGFNGGAGGAGKDGDDNEVSLVGYSPVYGKRRNRSIYIKK